MDATYMSANRTALCDEFPELDASIVAEVLAALNGDCDRARSQLSDMCGRKKPRVDDVAVGEFALHETVGDLFNVGDDVSLAHCVSECLAMGKGIATEFKKRFGQVAQLKAQHATIGSCAVLKVDQRWVYYLITKPRYFNKPALADVKRACVWMRDHALAHGVAHIAMPRIGCGLDGLQWADVRAMLVDVFAQTSLRVSVFRL